MNEKFSFNEIILSGIINYIFQCKNEKYIAFGLTCKKYSKKENSNIVYASLRIHKDLYNIYKDFFIKGKQIYINGYINSYSDTNKKIWNYITVTKVYEDTVSLIKNVKMSHIQYDESTDMFWNGKDCKAIPLSNEEIKEMEALLKKYQ